MSTLRGEAGSGVSRAPYACFNLGDHVGDDPAAVAENRRRLKQEAALPAEPSWLAQVHGVTVVDLDSARLKGPADGAVARGAGKVCAILTADCLPIVFATDSGDRVAAAHAGWRGLAAGIVQATVSAMHRAAVSIGPIDAFLGPSIGASVYEVGAEVLHAMRRSLPDAEAAFTPLANGKFRADLPALARQALAQVEVRSVYGGRWCTASDPDRFYSFRRERVTGRHAAVIWLRGAV